MKKIAKKIFPLVALVLLVACSDPYKKGLAEGKKQGYTEGYEVGYDAGTADGDEVGYERGKAYFESAGYNEGFSDGKKEGVSVGYAQGYTVGKNETYQPAYNQGYNVGYNAGSTNGYRRGLDTGYDDGYEDAADEVYDRGFNVGYTRGFSAGSNSGYDSGYEAGFDDGYDVGYDDGFADAGLSVGRSKSLKGYANLLSLAHNQVFDYSRIPAPKSTRRGLEVNGKILLSETSLTNKDTLKRLAVTEQYLVLEMAKQVKGKFGLSVERSLKVAKAANHFRKQSSKRALTSEDTNAYASEVIGSNFAQITKAYEATLQGDVNAFQSVLKRAAEKNQTSPENISIILAKYFI
jgi:flagellar biosynthesis/type III secretory pathway protein FliH